MPNPVSRIIRGIVGPNKTSGLITRADALRDAGDWAGSVAAYRAVLDEAPGLPHIWVQYGHAFKESGQHLQAEEAYRQALSLRDEADTHLQLGHLRKIMGRKTEAERDYLNALSRQPQNSDARRELAQMGWTGAKLRSHLATVESEGAQQQGPDAVAQAQPVLVFELSDLLDHLNHTNHPTGIQRVQLELANAVMENVPEARALFAYYHSARSRFVEVERNQLRDIIALVAHTDPREADRKAVLERLSEMLDNAPGLEFPRGSYLVNTGTSWGHSNYFLAIRDIRRRAGVRYVPLVHDCIPLLFPEFCNAALVPDFVNWVTQVSSHADLVLTNSQNTRSDFLKAVAQAGASAPPVEPIRLDGETALRKGMSEPDADRAADAVLRANNIDGRDFVLLVSTIEPRKNHMLALNAWSRMLKSRPADQVPPLVCVGNGGWMNDAVTQRLSRDRVLSEKVVILRDVSEPLLQALYSKCSFTLFPSLYEGWGLPISEALSHGKVPLVSRVASHPEAGGDLAVYFDLDSEADFQKKLETLIQNRDALRALEAKIKAVKPLRPWCDIADDIFALVGTAAKTATPLPVAGTEAFAAIATGKFYSMARNKASSIQDLLYSGEMFRDGAGWDAPGPQGSASRGLTADLTFNLSAAAGDAFLVYLFWRSPRLAKDGFTVSLPPTSWSRRVVLPPKTRRVEQISLQFAAGSPRNVRLRITAEKTLGPTSAAGSEDPAGFGVEGIYICRANDAGQRIAIVDAIVHDDFEALGRRFPEVVQL